MANLDLSKYGITGVTEILHNPSYDVLFAEETKPSLEGFEKGQNGYVWNRRCLQKKRLCP